MFCAECGKPVAASAKHCVYCGTSVEPAGGEAGAAGVPVQPAATVQAPPAVASPVYTPPPPATYGVAAPPAPPAPASYGAAVPPPPPSAGAYGYPRPVPPVPPAPGYAAPGYAAAGYPAAPGAAKRALTHAYAGAGCFVVSLVGSFLPFMTASAAGGDADEGSAWFMLWRDTGWGPAIGAIIAVALICALIPKRPATLAAALIALPAIALLPIRGVVYLDLEALGVNINFGVGWYLLLVFALAGCVLCFMAFVRMRRS